MEQLWATRGFDMREYKEASLARRVQARMHHARAESFEAYARYLDQHPDE